MKENRIELLYNINAGDQLLINTGDLVLAYNTSSGEYPFNSTNLAVILTVYIEFKHSQS